MSETAWRALVGLRLFESNRAADMQSFSFGAEREVPVQFGRQKGTLRKVGEYALHVQCPWVVSDGPRTIATAGDSRIGQWITSGDHRVESVSFEATGSMTLRFTSSHTLVVTPDSGSVGEYWRLLRPGTSEPHLVVSSRGVEFE